MSEPINAVAAPAGDGRVAAPQEWGRGMSATKTGRSIGRPPGPHGTRGKYTAGCRCDECRAANRVWINEHRALLRTLPLPADDPRHGRVSTYTNRGCRCPECRRAHQRANKAGAR